MKIGLGITTTPNRIIHESVFRLTSGDVAIHVNTDIEGEGVAESRNKLMKLMYDDGYDYIAIMDDDVRVLLSGWLEYAAEVMEELDLHCIGLPNSFDSMLLYGFSDITYWSDWIGAFHMFSRKFIEEVGYFCTAFDRYGFEDCHLQHRYRLKYSSDNGLPCPAKLPFYLMSEDVYGLAPPPSIPNEEKQRLIQINRSIFNKHVQSKQIYYPYHQK